jgi:NTP pyrophosphatase (non-canonical NTP hydrolase)
MNMAALHVANIARGKEWENSNDACDIYFWGVELAGEAGEACNIIKKLVREELGLRGSRATLQDLADELADVVICVDLIACHRKITLNPGKLPFMVIKANLAKLGNKLNAAVGMVNHIIADDRQNFTQLASMLCIVVHHAEAIAQIKKIDLEAAVRYKFNATSEKYGLATRMEAAA